MAKNKDKNLWHLSLKSGFGMADSQGKITQVSSLLAELPKQRMLGCKCIGLL